MAKKRPDCIAVNIDAFKRERVRARAKNVHNSAVLRARMRC